MTPFQLFVSENQFIMSFYEKHSRNLKKKFQQKTCNE